MTSTSSHDFPPVRACIFDVDGLLINSEDIYTEAYNNILHSYGKLDLPWSVKARQQSRGREGTLRLLEWAQLPISLEEWNAKVAAQRDLFRKSQPLPGVPELLYNLSRNTNPCVHIALASSAGRANFQVKTSHLPSIVDYISGQCRIFGDDEPMVGKKKKPAPDIFLLALDKINGGLGKGEERVTAEQCLVFEDSVAGVEAGRRAGMRVVWVPHDGLLGIWSGKEEMVLMGASEDGGEGSEGNGAVVERDENTDGGNGRGKRNTQDGDGGLLHSRDGWAEMLTSLEDFPYGQYGIQLGTLKQP